MPSQQHGGESDHRDEEFVTADPPHVAQFADVDQALDGNQHDRREHDVGQVGQQAGQVHQAQADRDRSEHQRERRFRAGLVVHRGLRQAAGDRVGLEESRGQIRRAQAQQFLARIDFVAVLLRQRARRGNAFHVREQQARECQRNHAVHVAHAQPRQAELGQALRHCADDLEAEIDQRRHRQHDDRNHHDEQRDRPARQEFFAEQQHGDRGETEGEHGEIGIRQLAARGRSMRSKKLSAALDAEQLRQLRHGDRQRSAGLEAEQDRFADEVDERTQLEQPRQYTHGRYDARRQRRNRRPACRIAVCHARDGDPDEHRDRRGRSDRELARRAEQRIEQAADQIAVDAVLRRQPGERCVGERHRNTVGGERHAGNRVVRQPLRTVGAQPLGRGKYRAPPARRGADRSSSLEVSCFSHDGIFYQLRHATKPALVGGGCLSAACFLRLKIGVIRSRLPILISLEPG